MIIRIEFETADTIESDANFEYLVGRLCEVLQPPIAIRQAAGVGIGGARCPDPFDTPDPDRKEENEDGQGQS